MKKTFTIALALALPIGLLLLWPFAGSQVCQARAQAPAAIDLPQPVLDGPASLEKTLQERRSVRTYRDEPLALQDVSQILWAAQGVTESGTGRRTAPSARALYPLTLHLLAGRVDGLPVGMYRYQPQGHRLLRSHAQDKKAELHGAVGQAPIQDAAAVIVMTGALDRGLTSRMIYLEGGHAAQNILLQAHARKIGAVVMANFKDDLLRKVLNLPDSEQPIYLLSMGRK